MLLEDDIERALVDLVGDLAAYRPHAKVVILEGKSEDGFDEICIRRLFPEIAKRVNLVSAGSKQRVRDLYEALNVSAERVGMKNRFFAIVDRDAEGFRGLQPGTQEFAWDVYHVENFLLEPAIIRAACRSLSGRELFDSDDATMVALKHVATEIVNSLIIEEMQLEVNNDLVGAIDVGAPPNATDVAADILPSIESSLARVAAKGQEYTRPHLEARVETVREEMEAFLETEEWIKRFPGRRILRRFVSEHLPKVGYEPFRNLLLDMMALSEHRPENMRDVLGEILDA